MQIVIKSEDLKDVFVSFWLEGMYSIGGNYTEKQWLALNDYLNECTEPDIECSDLIINVPERI
jgi:hypothetical protein